MNRITNGLIMNINTFQIPNKNIYFEGQNIVFKSENMVFESKNKNIHLQLQELKNDINEIREMVKCIYYAPGMPGAYEAETSFKNLNKQN